MATPVWIDGPLKGQQHEVPDSLVSEGIYRYQPNVTYTFAYVQVFERVVTVASVQTSPLSFPTLFEALLTPEAKRAAQ